MSVVEHAAAAHAVPDDALDALTHAQTRQDLGAHLHALTAELVDLKRRVIKVEHPGATGALIDLAVEVHGLQRDLAIAQAVYEQQKTPAHLVQVQMIQQALAAAKSQAQAAASSQDEDAPIIAVLKDLLASATTVKEE